MNEATVCRKCHKSKSELLIKQINSQRDGLAEKCVVTCKNCNFSYNLETSKQIGGKGGGSYEVNRRSVIATMSSGGGWSSLQNFCTQMNLPAPISQPAFAAQVKFIESASVTHAEEVMRAAAQCLRDLIFSENPELIDEDSDGALPCSVTVDGTWQRRLSDRVLLQRCLAGMTQNQNECVNGHVWAMSPKTRFCGKRRVVVAVCETIAVSNTGAASKAKLFEKSGVHIGKNRFRGLRFQDKTRLQSAAQKVSEKYIRTRTRKRQASKKKSDMSYLPGGFGTNPEPDFPVAKKSKTLKPSIGSKTLGKNQRKGNTGKHKKAQDEELSEDSITEEPKILFREPIFERIHGNSSGL